MGSPNRLIAAILLVAILAGGFWILILSPKRQEANDLGVEVEQLQSSLATAQSRAAEATAAKQEFPADYRKLVVLGKAVPGGEETSSLLVELNRVAKRAGVKFQSIQLSSEGGGSGSEAASTAPQAGPSAPVTSTVPATEAAAALLPLGAAIGPAGLAVMPYDLTFSGSFFHVADFIHGIDSMITTSKSGTAVDGRLVTLDGFVLTENGEKGFPDLSANFSVTTYLTPPGQGVTAGASPSSPAVTAAPAEASAATPSSYSTGAAK